jgi:chloride channel protein, CIC family
MVDRRVVGLSFLAILVAAVAAVLAQGLVRLIGLITNIAFYQRVSGDFVSPAGNKLGLWVIVVPVIGSILVGLMARYGSQAIRGHGIPEAMERVLFHQSRIQPRITFLKPLSAAIAIGTGGPFGAEGPIIATGGALGSVVGQLVTVTADERKTLLAAGAAAGMAATFGAPVSAVLLAIELLLFEYRARSIIPVALATATATGVRMAIVGSAPVFAMPNVAQPSGEALAAYIVIGGLVGVGSVVVTRAVYLVEDAFEKLPIHWMWWPALGGVAVGVIGYFSPKTLGVGYENIDAVLKGDLAGQALGIFCALKFCSWAIALGSGTSGGTLAPLFTIGGGLGAILGTLAALILPQYGIDPRVAALVGMAAMFAGASRALLASIVFAFECTQKPLGLLPLLGGSTAAFLASCLLMENSIMTERIARRGARVVGEYSADYLAQTLVRDCMTRDPVTVLDSVTVAEVRAQIDAPSHRSQGGFPVVDGEGKLVGVVTRGDLLDEGLDPSRAVRDVLVRRPVVIHELNSAREAADHMIAEGVGRLPVVAPDDPRHLVGIIRRADLLAAHQTRLHAARSAEPSQLIPKRLRERFGSKAEIEVPRA